MHFDGYSVTRASIVWGSDKNINVLEFKKCWCRVSVGFVTFVALLM